MSERNMRKVVVGKVVSNKMDKTIVVAVEDSVKHKLFGELAFALDVDKTKISEMISERF